MNGGRSSLGRDNHHYPAVMGPEQPSLSNAGGDRTPVILLASWRQEGKWPKRLAAGVDPRRPVIRVPPPRADRADEYPSTVEEWADRVLPTVLPLLPEGPYTVGGWSFGGLLGAVLGERLAVQHGRPPARLFLLDTALPTRHAKPDHYWQRAADALDRTATQLSTCAESEHPTRAVARRVGVSVMARARRRYDRVVVRDKTQKKPLRKTVQWTEGDQESMLKRAVWVCYLKYREREFAAPTTLFACDQSVERWGITLGWHAALRGDFEVVRVPGHHTTFFDGPGAGRIIETVETRCAEIDSRLPATGSTRSNRHDQCGERAGS